MRESMTVKSDGEPFSGDDDVKEILCFDIVRNDILPGCAGAFSSVGSAR